MMNIDHRPTHDPEIRSRVMEYVRDPRGGSRAPLFGDLAASAPVLALPLGMFLISSAQLVRRAAAMPQLVIGPVEFPSDATEQAPDFIEFFTSSLSFLGRDDHHRLRRVVSEHFTPRGVEATKPALERIVRDLIAETLAAGAEVDFVSQFSNELPARSMGLLLGMPEQEWPYITASGRAMLARIATSFPGLAPQDEPIGNDDFRTLRDRVERLLDDDVPPDSLAASMRDAVVRGELDRSEATRLMLLLFMTGVDTVAASVTNIVTTLMDNDEARTAWLCGDVPTSDVVDEALRLGTPLPFGMRLAVADLRLGGTLIPAGSTVMLCNAAANLDPARFDAPQSWQPGRRPSTQTFGHGTYRCLGAMFATQECEVALDALKPLGVRVTDHSQVLWRSDISFHTPTRLPVRVGAGWGSSQDAGTTVGDTDRRRVAPDRAVARAGAAS